MTAERCQEEAASNSVQLVPVAEFANMRALAWHGDVVYASRGYELFRAHVSWDIAKIKWESVGNYRPAPWRVWTSRTRLSSRLVRDGFHALAVLASGTLIAAVPGAILTLPPGEREFRVTYRITRGTRPLHIVATPQGHIYWGEYFDNVARDEVHVFGSSDFGESWSAAYTFPAKSIRHVHNVLYDRWADRLWVFTGDYGDECRVLRVTPNFREVETVLAGNQQARAVAAIPTEQGLYFSTDTPLEQNFVYCMTRKGKLQQTSGLSSSSIYGCAVGKAVFFSTMVEPSKVNPDQHVRLYGACAGSDFHELLSWQKDAWSMRFFQYGNAFLTDGENTSGCLAFTTAAVENADQKLQLFSVKMGGR